MDLLEKYGNLIVPSLVLGVLFLFLYSYTLKEPYHLDSAFYMQTVRGFLEDGKIQCHYGTRCMVEYTLLPLSLLFGSLTLPLTIVLTALIGLFAYCLWVRDISNNTAGLISAALLLIIPSSIITITHVKEDFVGLMYLALSLYLVKKASSPYLKCFSGILFGFALLSKEPMVLFIPFYLAYAYLCSVKVKSKYSELVSKGNIILGVKNAMVFFAPAMLAVLLINSSQFISTFNLTKSPYLGQFLGFFSPLLPVGINLWIQGIGMLLFCLQFMGFVGVYLEKNKQNKVIYGLLMIQFIVLFFSFCNNTVVQYRYFLWTSFISFPMMVLGLQKLLAYWKAEKHANIVAYAIFGFTAISLLMQTIPVISFHSSYNPVSGFYSNIPAAKGDVLFLGMDSCGLVDYYARVKCINHPVDASAESARDFTSMIDSYMRNGTKVYLIPDFFSYDGNGEVQKAFDKFQETSVYENWYQDYHAMDYGIALDDYKNEVASQYPNCKVEYKLAGQQVLTQEFKADIYTYTVSCGVSAPRKLNVISAGGRIIPGFGKGRVVQIT